MPQAPKRLRLRRTRGRTLKAAREAVYGRRWARMAKAFLRANPACFCDRVKVWDGSRVLVVAIGREGQVAPAVLVDHVRAVNAGGPMWDPDNWQPICRACHAVKGRRWG